MKIKKAMRILAMLVIFSILLATTIFAAPQGPVHIFPRITQT